MIDTALENFNKFKTEFESYRTSDMSESDTRSKLLDHLLIKVLGWKETDINREGYVKPGYFDYEVSTSNFRFIIEAKKNFHELTFPDKGDKIKLKTLKKGNEEVINQIREYIQKRNLTYGVISNGHQFIVGRFVNTDGSNWEENEAFIFKGLEHIEQNFIKFYNLLSRTSIQQNGRIRFFLDDVAGSRLIESLVLKNKSDELIRNDYSQYLYPIITQIFSEIYEIENLSDAEILKQCYIKNEDLNKHTSELNVLFNDEPPKFDSRIIPLRNTKNTHEHLSGEITQQHIKTPDPIVIIGSKGAGKTTFIKYFSEVILSEKIKNNRPLLYVDFRGYTKQQVLDTNAIYRKLLNQLYDNYPKLNLTQFNILKKIYSKEIKRNTEGKWKPFTSDSNLLEQKISDFIDQISKNDIEHFEKVSEYLVQVCHKRLVIILDNADQLSIDTQKEVYLLGQSLKRNLKSLVMISLREGYYFQWKNKPPFDAYQSPVVHITAPYYGAVLKSRIQYVIDNYDFDSLQGSTNTAKFKFSPALLGNFFDNLKKTLFEEKNSEILNFLEETSYPDIRAGLEKFNFFLLSGHTKITDYMTSSDFTIPIWEFVKSVALESKYYYHHEESIISNLFYPAKNNRNHFTKIRILNYLYDLAETHSFKDFHLPIGELNVAFELAGHNQDIIYNEVSQLIDYKMIETKSISSDVEEGVELTPESEIRINSCGIYYLKMLLNSFHYIDLVLQDTPIYDPHYFNLLQEAFAHSNKKGIRDLGERIESTQVFMEYLKNQEKEDHIRNDSTYGVKSLDLNIVDSIYSNGLQKDLSRVKAKAV
ncbi:MAG: hypothetical protein RLO17_07635 [Cyclobacteriaceae bacterium]